MSRTFPLALLVCFGLMLVVAVTTAHGACIGSWSWPSPELW